MNEMIKKSKDLESNIFSSAVGVSVRDVSKTFGSLNVLQEVSLEIEPGSFHVLIGPSGCGKTTLLRMIGGLETPTSGVIDFQSPQDHLSNERRDQKRSEIAHGRTLNLGELSYGFQEPRLLPWRSVEANVALPLELAGEPIN